MTAIGLRTAATATLVLDGCLAVVDSFHEAATHLGVVLDPWSWGRRWVDTSQEVRTTPVILSAAKHHTDSPGSIGEILRCARGGMWDSRGFEGLRRAACLPKLGQDGLADAPGDRLDVGAV